MNRSFNLSMVCPTYCLPHCLQVIQYTMFELLQDMFFIVTYLCLVYVQVMCPVLSKSGQYLQSLLLQKLNPLCLLTCFGLVSLLEVLARSTVDVDGLGAICCFGKSLAKLSVMDFCLNGTFVFDAS